MRAYMSLVYGVVCGAFFLGCANNLIEMKYTSSIQHSYQFNINAPVIIAPYKGDLLAASYILFIKQELEKRGFNSLYMKGQIPEMQKKYFAL